MLLIRKYDLYPSMSRGTPKGLDSKIWYGRIFKAVMAPAASYSFRSSSERYGYVQSPACLKHMRSIEGQMSRPIVRGMPRYMQNYFYSLYRPMFYLDELLNRSRLLMKLVGDSAHETEN